MAEETRQETNESEPEIIDPKLEQQLIQQWSNIGICNDFIFCKIMQDEKLLAQLIRLILANAINCRF